jgi:hypothetical protein
MATQEDSELFELEMEFRKGQGDPTRAFKAMTGLIEALTLTGFDPSLLT